MSLPAILPTAFGSALGPPFGGIGAKLTLLTGSGTWKPHPKAGRVLIIATGPGGIGVADNYSGGAGGTAIKMLDLTQLSGQGLPYVVGGSGSGIATTIAGLTANPGSGISGGSASGGDMNLPGGRGEYCPVLSVSTSVSVTGNPVAVGGGGPYTWPYPSGTYNPIASASGSSTVTKGNAPGGASYWGGCDTLTSTATLYGVGGPVDASSAYTGGPGVIYILGDLSDG